MFDREENIVGKGENVGYQHFLLFPQCFLQSIFSGLLVQSLAQPSFFLRIDDGHSSLTNVCCFDDSCVGKQPVAWKQYCEEYWLKELQESMDRCTGRRNIIELMEKHQCTYQTIFCLEQL